MEKINRRIAEYLFLSVVLLFATLKTNLPEHLVEVDTTFPSREEGKTVVYVDPSACYAALGSTFMVNVSIANVTSLYGYQFKLYYDTNLLDGIEVTLPEGHFLEPVDPGRIWISRLVVEDKFNSTHGEVLTAVLLMGDEPGKTGSGVLATITFHVVKSGNCLLDLYDRSVTLVNDDLETIDREVLDGYFESKIIEHEIALFLEVPSHLVPGESADIHATVQNGGQNNESNVVIQLLIDGVIIDSMEIGLLQVDSSHTLNYSWTPRTEAIHNVTAYAPSLAREDNTLNNVNSRTVVVSYVIKVPVHFPTIKEALQAANGRDTIQVASGTYCEHLLIDKSVTLVGENMNNTIIDGSGTWKIVQIRKQFMYGWTNVDCKISEFTIQNGLIGICVESLGNIIEENTIRNCENGIFLDSGSSGNIIRRNTIANNNYGILCDGSGNTIYHNNLVNNTIQAHDHGSNAWDYTGEGNYWSDYNGTDTDEDNIGDVSYEVNATVGTEDTAPLMFEYVSLLGDLNDDGKVNVLDLGVAAKSFGSYPGHPRWNPAADTNNDGRVNMIDIIIIAKNFGKTQPR